MAGKNKRWSTTSDIRTSRSAKDTVETRLSLSHRRLLPQRLSHRSEKEIADLPGLSRATSHKVVTDIYRNFNLFSRAGLMTALEERQLIGCDPCYLAR